MINYSLPISLNVFVWEGVFYDEDISNKNWIKCSVVGVSSYKGETLTFTVMVEEGQGKGSIFCYVPFHYVKWNINDSNAKLSDLIYHNNPDGIVSISILSLPKAVSVYNKTENCWAKGEYLVTLDWYESNLLCHLIKLNNGFFALQPNHKVKFGENSPLVFPSYKKMRKTWKI